MTYPNGLTPSSATTNTLNTLKTSSFADATSFLSSSGGTFTTRDIYDTDNSGGLSVTPSEVTLTGVGKEPVDVLLRIPFKDRHGNPSSLILTESEAYKLYEILGEKLNFK